VAQYGSQLVKMSPDCFEAWYDLGVANHELERYDQAVQAYEKAVRLKADAAAYANLGLVLAARGDTTEARKAHERAIELAPDNPQPLWNLSLFYEQQGEAEEAELALEQLVELKPDWPEAWFRLGRMRLGRKDYISAAEGFDMCCRLRPGWPEAALNGAISRHHAGDPEGARRGFQIAAAAGIGEAWKGLAALSAASGDGPKASEEYEKAAASGVICGELAYNVGLALYDSGDYAGAASYYGQALKHQPDLPEALLNLGHALHQLGQEDDARCCWTKAIEAHPAFAAEYFD
jgi:tetratricopeptide (TPR) repeat protein